MTEDSPFALPGKDVAAVLERLRGLGTLAPETPETQQRAYYDTFDWRLFAAGLVLWRQGQGRGARLVLASRINEDTELSVAMPKMVRFAWELRNQALRRRLQPVLEMRALTPVAEVTIQRRGYRLLNEDGKTVIRVAVDYPVVRTDQDALVSLAARFHLFGVRGYEDALADARASVGGESFEAIRGADLLVEALRSIGREAGGYSSKLDIPLDAEMPADAATRRVLDHLMSTLTANIEGTRADLDSEFLHDLRVAVRRTRSALSQVKQVFDAAFTQKYADEFRWVGEITGPTRDLDVYLLEYDDYRDSLPVRMQADLAPFKEFLHAHQRREQRRLKRQLQGERFTALLEQWRTFLDAPGTPAGKAANAARPIKVVASERIWKMYRRVLKEGRAIQPDSPPEDLHELRKSCKKLRYLVEFFQYLYGQERVKDLVKSLKQLLDNLGEFQDLEVHAGQLGHFAEQMKKEGEVPLGTQLAMGALVAGLLHRQQEARAEFAKRFKAFDTRRNRDLYRELFKPGQPSAAAGGRAA